MRHTTNRWVFLGAAAAAAACVLLLAGAPRAAFGDNLTTPQPNGPCGLVFHNFPRVLNMSWTVVPGANGYQVEVDCKDCKVVGKWDSETPAGAAMFGVTANSATFTFPGDNQGRWRVRATQTASAPKMSAIQAGPWSTWCNFAFKTGSNPSGPSGGYPPGWCGINLASLSKSSGHPGDTFQMIGTWTASQGTKEVCINKGGVHHLELAQPWNATVLTVRIPVGLQPGTGYMVGVYCQPIENASGTVSSSGWKPFEVLPDLTTVTNPKKM